MEELIGDITDEYDLPDQQAASIDHLDGLTTIEEFAELTGYIIPEGPYDTVAGYFMAVYGELPSTGAHVTVWLAPQASGDDDTEMSFIFEVTAMDGRRAAWFALRRVEEVAGDTHA